MAKNNESQEVDDGEEVDSVPILERFVYWVPAIIFGLSLVFVLVTVVAIPLKRRVQKKDPDEYFKPAFEVLKKINNNKNVFTLNQKLIEFTTARVNMLRLTRHYRKSVGFQSGAYSNPYLLLAEIDKHLASVSIPTRKKKLLSDALVNYSLAFDLEEKSRGKSGDGLWDKQFFYKEKDSSLPKKDVVKIRKLRRRRYILYNLGIINIEMNRGTTAARIFTQLKRNFFEEEMARLRAERTGKQYNNLSSQILPVDYELLDEDKVKLYYFLAQVADINGQKEMAERDYRVFLLKAGRSRERFISKMRIGEFAFNRGKAYLSKVENFAGKEKAELKNKAILEFGNAADIYAEIIEESAPEDLLRDAYFKGGIANLEYAATMDVGRETSWDYMAREFEAFRSSLERFSGMKLPERTLNLPETLASRIISDSTSIPGITSDVPSLLAGSVLSIVTKTRITPVKERDMRLVKARSYFDAASSGTKGRYVGESRVLIGKSLIVEQSNDRARRVLKHAIEAYPSPHIKIACLLGIGLTQTNENRLDDAWATYLKLPSVDKLPTSTLYPMADIKQSIIRLARSYVRKADRLNYSELWLDAPPGSDKMINAINNSKNIYRSLTQAVAAYRLLLDKYSADDIGIKVNMAAIYSRLAKLLQKKPFGIAKDLVKSRNYRISAADTYMRVAVEHPGSFYDVDALLNAGNLFYDSGAYERCCDSFELFNTRYGLTDQIGRVRNILGLAYQKLGLYGKAEKILRVNAQYSTTSEGRKGLFYLGNTYLLWSEFEPKKEHLGGPESTLLLSRRDDEAEKVSSLLYMRDITDWNGLLASLISDSGNFTSTPGKRVKELLSNELLVYLNDIDARDKVSENLKNWLLTDLNNIIKKTNLYTESAWLGIVLSDEILELLRRNVADMGPSEKMRLNRLLLDVAFPQFVVSTKCEIRLMCYRGQQERFLSTLDVNRE